MMTSQCVPGWDSDHIINTNSDVPSMEDDEVAELTWENGHLAMHGLRPPRRSTKPPPPANYVAAWDKPRPRPGPGTLESLVNQATTCFHPPPAVNDVDPWFDHRRAAAAVVDAIVPCNNHRQDSSKTNASARESTATCGDQHQVAPGGGGLTSTSLWSEEYSKTTSGDSVSHSRSQREEGGDDEVEKKKKKLTKSGSGKSSVSTKRSRAAAIHNQSERKRRDKINQKMQTLQKLVPNSSKTDKASILDEVIEYLKQLQAQVHTMNRINIPQMMLQHHFQMSMMAATAAAHHMPPPFMPMPGSWDMQGDRPVMPHDFMSAFLAGQSAQSQPMTMDAYSRLAALYQQFRQQGPGPGPVSSSKN